MVNFENYRTRPSIAREIYTTLNQVQAILNPVKNTHKNIN